MRITDFVLALPIFFCAGGPGAVRSSIRAILVLG